MAPETEITSAASSAPFASRIFDARRTGRIGTLEKILKRESDDNDTH
uniref:Uncharacterized protein n=1 Tax=Candidatus Kentrum sp. DK TaxID=2126562 RepID=A0A450RY19_9GAMM|nr:MAG: hypothetical protein BECKDK2373B_GA0170837_10072 [Candidatus Kentron sp. DK]